MSAIGIRIRKGKAQIFLIKGRGLAQVGDEKYDVSHLDGYCLVINRAGLVDPLALMPTVGDGRFECQFFFLGDHNGQAQAAWVFAFDQSTMLLKAWETRKFSGEVIQSCLVVDAPSDLSECGSFSRPLGS